MCNLYQLEKGPDAIRRLFADIQMPLDFPEGVPNFQPRNVRISERAPIVRFNRDTGAAELVERRWSWPAPGGKPVFNMRSDGREFSRDRVALGGVKRFVVIEVHPIECCQRIQRLKPAACNAVQQA